GHVTGVQTCALPISKYLSAQFNRSVFEASNKNKDKLKLPFVNNLWTESAYNVFLQYVGYQKNSTTFKTYQQIPAKFMDDFVVRRSEERRVGKECSTR